MTLSLIDRLSSVKVERFIAPVPAARNVYVFTVQGGIAFQFEVVRYTPEPGWYVLRPAGRTTAEVLHEVKSTAHMFSYLEQLPKWTVMTLFPSGDQRWAVCPFNKSDAQQRGWGNTVRHMHIVRGTIHSGSVAACCDMGGTLIFHSVKRLRPELSKEASSIVDGYLQEVEKQRQEQRRQDIKSDMTFEEQLAVGGAEMIALENGRVKWEHEGAHYEMDVAPDGTIMSAGFCLTGEDNGVNTTREHSLVSIVGVMKRHRELGRTY
jgi:hypothetical protein